jgi:hypothetical protein
LKYRLIAFDLDGTLVKRDGLIPESYKAAIGQAIASGMMVTLATGRMFRPAAHFARELGLRLPIICYQGSLIAGPWDGEALFHQPMSIEEAREAIEVMRQVPVHLNLYLDDELYVEEITDGAKRYAQFNGVELNLVPDLAAFLEREPTKLMAWGKPENIDGLFPHLKAHLGSRFLITKSYSTLCEVGHPATGKGRALEYLARLLGVERGQTVAVGDGPNDVDMLEWVGLGVVVGSPPGEVVAAADWVTDPEAENNIPEIVERLLSM